MTQYPTMELPLPQADYSAKTVTNVATTTFSSGRPRRRRLSVGVYHAAKLAWQLSPAEYDFFMAWWEHVLYSGALPFTVEMATGEMLGPHVVQLIDDPESTLQGYFWKVSCEAVLLSKPVMDASVVRGLISAGVSRAAFVVAEDALQTVVNASLPSHLT